MDNTSSNLTSIGCDFVVATTEASINSGLREYLQEETQPVTYICFLANPDTGNPENQVSLEDLMSQTGGINPFDIPEGTPYDDSRITACTDALFAVGIKMQMGTPPGVEPRDLPIVTLGESASSVTFNMYCSDVTVIQNSPGGGFSKKGHWNVWKQPSGQPWTASCHVDLVLADLDKELDTPYLNSHPEAKEQLKEALENLSGTAFSLQQLMYDLDNATLQDTPNFPGMDMDQDAGYVLGRYFVTKYRDTAKDHGLPLLAVAAVAHTSDDSTLTMTAMEKMVNPPKDSNGNRISSPTPSEQAITTLNYLCAINNDTVPQISGFNWNWVQPADVDNESGVIAIRRNLLAQYFLDTLKTATPEYLYQFVAYSDDDYKLQILKGEWLDYATADLISDDSSHVVHIQAGEPPYDPMRPYDEVYYGIKVRVLPHWDYMQLVFYPGYSCDAYFDGKEIRIEQRVWVTCGPSNINEDTWARKLYDKYLTDTYSISVGQSGELQLVKTSSKPLDKSDPPDPKGDLNSDDIDKIQRGFFNEVQKQIDDLIPGELHELKICQPNSFIFPGAKVFTYKEPFFSKHQDLITNITYVDFKVPDPDPQNDPQPVTPPPKTGTVGKLTASTELMQNYVQGEVISPKDKFEALQSSDGHSLLFAIDSSGIFHIIEEQSGTSHTGWQVHDLSTAIIKSQFYGRESEAVVRTFDVGQSVSDGSIGLMMAVTLDGTDRLFISLGNSSSDTSWVSNPTWKLVPFDPEGESSQNITIAGTMFAESQSMKQYLVVDINRGSQNDPHIARYYIDSARMNGHYWIKNDVTIDISSGQYQSIVGRVKGKPVDGIYTAGHTGGLAQLIYEPIFNYYGQGPVIPIRLQLPGGAIPSAIAAARSTDGSELYAVGGSTLYYFPADKQTDEAYPTALMTLDIFSGTDTLKAMTHDGVTTLWGRNSSNKVFHLSCPVKELDNPISWSPPMVVLSGAERISPYMNCIDGGNTIFASGNGKIQRLMQGSAQTGRAWRAQEITLAAPPTQKATSFKSYTTSIHVMQFDKELPAPKAVVDLSASTRTPVYINGLYYVLSENAIQVTSDATGLITVVEATDNDNVHAAVITATIDNTNVVVNPMDKTFSKLTSLKTQDKLRGAQFPSQTVAGGIVGDPGFTSLVQSSVSDDDVKAAAQNLDLLDGAYSQLKNPGKQSSSVQLHASSHAGHNGAPAGGRVSNLNFLGDFFHTLGTWVGDIKQVFDNLGKVLKTAFGNTIQWIKHEAETFGRIVHDTVTNTMHFFAKIGDQIYHAALDTFHAIVGAGQWLFDKIKTGFETLIRFLETLFHWDDIRRSKDVMHNMVKLWLQDQVDNIPKAKQAFDGTIANVENQVNAFANINDWSPGLGDAGKKPASGSVTNTSENHTPSSRLLSDKYRDHAGQLTILGDSPALNGVEKLINNLVTALSSEAKVLGSIFTQLQELTNQFSSLSVVDVLKRLMAILVDGVLSSIQVVVDTVLNVLHDLAQSAIAILDSKIHIPVISDILNAIGIPDLSFLDLFTWIGATAFTVVYKIVQGHAPFASNDDSVKSIVSAGSWDDMAQLFGQPSTGTILSSSSKSSSVAAEHNSLIQLPDSIKKPIFAACHMNAGILGLVGNLVSAMEAEDQSGNSFIGIPAAVIGIICAASTAAGDFLVPMYPVKSLPFKILSIITSVIVIGCKVIFSGLAQAGFQKFNVGPMICEDARGVGAMLNAVLVIHGAVVTLWHFYELGQTSSDSTRTAAILGEVSNLASYISRLSYALAVNDEEPDSRLIAILVMGAANDVAFGLQLTESITGQSAFK